MRTAAVFGLAALAAGAIASDVHDLKQDTFKSFIEEHNLVLAEFFAPWCGHCKALAPEYEEAATQLKEKDIPLAKVDCTEEAELCSSYGVEGYPTLKIFRGPDNVSPYSGQRKAQAIISYMTKQAMPAVSVLDSKTLPDFKTADKVVLIGYFAADDKSSNETFSSVAEGLRDSFLFGATNDAALAKAEGVKQPAIVLYKTFDEGKNTFTDKFSKSAIEDFAKVASVPLVGEVGPETYAGYMAAGIPLAYIFAETPEEREELAAALKPVAQKHKGKINIATIDATAFGQHAGNLNLEIGNWPAFAIQDTQKNQKFPYTQGQKLTEAAIGKFVDDFLAGKIEPSIKSEPIPEKNDGPVTVIVAHNYKDIVLDDSKDVLVEFYAPWCGHCKALAPKYEELGSLYASHPNIVIAKVDATANDVPEEIQGFPTIKLYAAGRKSEPVEYTGSRTVEDLANFIKENGAHGIDVYGDSDEKLELRDLSDMPEQAAAATKSAKDAASGAASKVSGAGEAATDAAADAASQASGSAASVAGKATDAAADAASKASGTAAGAASKATDAAANAASQASGSAASAGSKVSEAASGAAEKATGAAADAASKASGSAGSAASKATDAAGSAASKATDAAGSAAEKATAPASEAATDAANKASGAAAKGAEAVKEKVKTKISEGAEAVKTMVMDDDDMAAEHHDEL
ncbi:protein disulfide-isomerase precursor [Coniosporium tulheliwenetii]|uniref:Protein disulfide-isomerase n=1 Tax=Coniosporium tulheliwenetii TaxID=3383036 RepID=A0ACC2ZI82_9PEZI|nr:protein disulfide-isomerase precursor [Cladosporium sp. JES 115]